MSKARLIYEEIRHESLKSYSEGTKARLLSAFTASLHYSGSAGSDDYEIVLPRVVTGQNLTWAMVGPRYTVDKPVMLEILGPR